MNLSNYYWYFTSVIPPRICDDIVKHGLSKADTMARTGGYDNKKLTKNVAELINDLDKHNVEIKVDDHSRDLDYLGNKSYGVNLPIELIGLEKGLEEIYNAL